MNDKPCKNCGYCPHCGRSDRQVTRPWPYVPYTPPYVPGPVTPWPHGPYRITWGSGSSTTPEHLKGSIAINSSVMC